MNVNRRKGVDFFDSLYISNRPMMNPMQPQMVPMQPQMVAMQPQMVPMYQPQMVPTMMVPPQQPSTMMQPINNAMESIQPAFERFSQATSDTFENVQKGVSQILPKVPTLDSIQPLTLSSNLPEHAAESTSNTSKFFDFFSFNSVITKIAFLLFIVIMFLILVKLTMSIMVYTYQESNNPTLVQGVIPGTTAMTLSRDPNHSHVTLPRSNNQYYGAEFTWSVWLNVNSLSDQPTYSHVFNLGNKSALNNGIMSVNNAPGLYFMKNQSASSQTGYSLGMHIVMDTEPYNDYTIDNSQNSFSHVVQSTSVNTQSSVVHTKTLDISELPLNNWFHVVLRLENSVLDIYINGTITGRINFETVPKQNFYDVQICQNGGFNGYLSNLKYYAHALNIFDINALVLGGPNLSTPQVSAATGSPSVLSTNQLNSYDYLSQNWYNRH